MMQSLSNAEAQEKLKEFGLNLIQEKKRRSLILKFLDQFKDVMVIILIAAAVFAFFAHEKVDAVIILGIVILNAAIGFVQEFKAERAVDALKRMLAPKAHVVRDGQKQLIEAKYLVPGDVIIIQEGDKISADCRLIAENELMIDESILTGESVSVKKDAAENNKLFMGTQAAGGNGRAVVTATGMRTEFGKIAALTSETEKDKSPLQKELAGIGLFVGKVTIGISFILFIIGYFVQGRQLIETILFAVSVAVAAVPEGLPATITVALAIGVQRLARKNAIIKQLSSVETLGSTTVICSDKTGTLTKNEMTVREIVLGGFEISVRGSGYEPEGVFAVHNTSSKSMPYFEYEKRDGPETAYKKPAFFGHLQLACRTASICNNARLLKDENERWQIIGDPTEGALITAAEKAGFEINRTLEKHQRTHEFPFDSRRKRMSVTAKEIETKQTFVYAKGAPSSIIEICTHILKDNKNSILTEREKADILKRTDQMAGRALRVIALAYKPVAEPKDKYQKEEAENDLVFLGLMGMIDPPREEVKEAVKLTHKAGIRIFIITGDHALTAHAIARELGIADSYGINLVTGAELDKMPDEKLTALTAAGQQTIFARVSPEHKLRIVDAIKKTGEIVAVTGDGVNDAPALKRADIGVAMGITGTDVSREAANMVLADDSFNSIVTAVIEGRTIYENMRKFIYYIFAANIGELLAIFMTILMTLPAPLTAVLILIVNTLTDVFPSLALGVEPVERNILERPPRKPNAKIMEASFIRRYTIVGLLIGSVTAAVFIWNLKNHGWKFGQTLNIDSTLYMQSATMAFVVLTLLQMVHAFICRSETQSFFKMNHLKNPYLLLAVASSTLITIAVVQMPFFNRYLKTTALTSQQWAFLTAASFSILLFEEIRKFFTRRKFKRLAASC